VPGAARRPRRAHRGWGDIGDEGVARRAADALADAVDEPGHEHQAGAGGEGEERLGQRAEAVAEDGERFAATPVVAQYAGEHPDDQRRRLGKPLDEANDEGARAECGDQEDRQQAVDELRRHVHQEADEPERPDGGWNGRTPRHGCSPWVPIRSVTPVPNICQARPIDA